MNLKITEIAQWVSGKIAGDTNQTISRVYIDSRMILDPENALFVALNGAQKSGHEYISHAYQKGIRVFMVNQLPKKAYENATFLCVEDGLQALQKWATQHRKKFQIPIVAITGTNGKTIVKEWLYQLLFSHYTIARSPKSYNSQIGVPLSIFKLESNDTLGIFEAGISQPHEMEKLRKMLAPSLGILTHMGTAHSAFFETRAQHIHEKLKLFHHCPLLILPYQKEILSEIDKIPELQNTKLFTWGENQKANLQITKTIEKKRHTHIFLSYQNQPLEIQIPFTGKAACENAISCLAVCLNLDIPLDEIVPKFTSLVPIEMRLETKSGLRDTVIINDAFNSDLSSIPIALHHLDAYPMPQKTLVLTDVLQQQMPEQDLYKQIADWVNAYPFQKVYLIGEVITKYAHLFLAKCASFENTEAFLSEISLESFSDEVILLKGARKFQLEKISTLLQEKTHDTVLEVHLGNLLQNVNYFKSKLVPETKMMCMVKAFGYGTGGYEIAQALQNHQIDYLGVAYADEGAMLRENGVHIPIMVMNPEQSSYSHIIENNLEPEIYSFRVLNKFTQSLIKAKISKAYPIHLKLNTGMNRLGFQSSEMPQLMQELWENPYVKVVSVFSHLAAADDANEKKFTQKQIHSFREMADYLSERLGYTPIRHILNTEGILNYNDAQMEMVRLGIGMYGICSSSEHQKHLKTVVNFKTVISQIHTLAKGETIGYGRTFKTNRTMRIAILPVGYADGVKRKLSNGEGKIWIAGDWAPIVGTICMDMLMVDVTDIDCQEGDQAILFGEKPSLATYAKWLETIPYEALTSISSRVKRIYIHET